jgi:nitroreductase
MTSESTAGERAGPGATPRERVRPLLRVRQTREFEPEPPTDEELAAIVDAARWSGSAANEQPWRFMVLRDRATLMAIHQAGMPQTRGLATAPAAIAIVLPGDERAISRAYDEGRAAERILVAAHLLGLAAGISWIRTAVGPTVAPLLGLPADRFVRTIVAIGHPTERARQPNSPPGQARLPRDQVVVEDRWPAG